MSHFVAKLHELPTGCLFGSGDDCPMARALAARQDPTRPTPEERYDQVRAFLSGTEIPEEVREAYLASIKDNPRKLGECYTNYFSQIYTQLWVETLAQHIKKVLSDFCKNNQKLLEGWQNNQLSELVQRVMKNG